MIILEDYLEENNIFIDMTTIYTDNLKSLKYTQKEVELFFHIFEEKHYLKFYYPKNIKTWFIYFNLTEAQVEFLLGKVISVCSSPYVIKGIQRVNYESAYILSFDPL